jgi:hypothetical protein
MSLSRYFAPAVLAASLGFAAVAAPAPVQAQSDDLVRVLVNVADVVMRNNQPYYRYGDYGYNDRLIGQRDRYGRIVYYRSVPRAQYRNGPPYGNAYGYDNRPGNGRHKVVTCNRFGRCTTSYTYASNDRRDYNDRDRHEYNDRDRHEYNDRDRHDGDDRGHDRH